MRLWLVLVISLWVSSIAFAIAPSDINVVVNNLPGQLYKDMNFQVTWSGSDANVLNWKFDTDGNTIVSGQTDLNWTVTSSGAGVPLLVASPTIDGLGSLEIVTPTVATSVTTQADKNFTSIADGSDYNAWVRTTDPINTDVVYELRGLTGTVRLAIIGGAFRMQTNAGFTDSGTAVANTWYRFSMAFDTGAGTVDLRVFNDSNTLLASSNKSYATDLDYFRLRVQDNNSASANTINFDLVDYLNGSTEATDSFPFTPLSSPTYQTHTFNTSGNKNVQVTVSNTDGNASGQVNLNIPADSTNPTINQFDVNVSSNTWSAVLNCSDNFSSTIDLNILINGSVVYTQAGASVDTNYYVDSNLFPGFGTNTFTAKCTDPSDNTATSSSITAVFLQVKIPKDITNMQNVTPFSLVSSDLNINQSGLTNDQNFSGLSLLSNINIRIDTNSDFFPVTYVIDSTSTSATQPYVTPTDDGSTLVAITQTGTRAPIPNILIQVYKSSGTSNLLIQSVVTDVTGSGTLYLISGDQYTLNFYYNGTLLDSNVGFNPTVTPTYFYFNLELGQPVSPTESPVRVSFNPSLNFIPDSVTSLIQDINGSKVNHAVVRFYQFVGDVGTDKNFLYSVSQVCNVSCSISTTISSLGFDVNKTLYVDVNAYLDSNALVSEFHHSYTQSLTSVDLRQLFSNARTSFGCAANSWLPCPWSTIVSIVITLLIVGLIVIRLGYISGPGMAVLGLLVLGFLAYVGWFYWVIYILMIFVLGLGMISRSVTT